MENPNFINPPVQPVLPHKSYSHWLVVAAAITTVVGLLVFSSYLYLWPVTKHAYPTPTDEAFYNSVPDPTADWKTYTNAKYGFDFKYPENLKPVTCHFDFSGSDEDIFLIDTNNLPLYWESPEAVCGAVKAEQFDESGALHIILGKPNIRDYMCNIGDKNWREREIPVTGVTIGGKEALYCDTPSLFVGINHHVVLINEADQGITLIYDYSNDNMAPKILGDQILSTFKFIDSTDTSTWKTYTNTEYGFEFKYPGDENFKVSTKIIYGVPTLFFCFSTVYPNSDSNCDKNYASIFYVGIFSDSQWDEDQKSDYGKSIFLIKNDKFVMGYGMAQEPLEGHAEIYKNFNQILSTFRFTK